MSRDVGNFATTMPLGTIVEKSTVSMKNSYSLDIAKSQVHSPCPG